MTKQFSILIQNVLFVLLGFIVFSSFDTTLCLDILHFPQLFPELLIIPFCFLLKKKFKTLRIDVHLFLRLLYVLVFLLILAIVIGKFEIIGILSIFRSFLYMIFFVCIFKNPNHIDTDDIQWLTLGSLLGWFYDSHINFTRLIVDFNMENITYGLLLAFPLFFSIVYVKKKYCLAIVGLGLSLGIFIYAGIRRIIAVFLISIIVLFVIELIGQFKKIFSIILISGILIVTYYLFSVQIESYVMEASPQLHYRMYVRTEQTMGGNSGDADKKRMNNLSEFEKQGELLFIPRGLYTNHTSEKGAGIFNDMPLAALTWVLGLPITVLLLLSLIIKTKKAFNNYIKSDNTDIVPYVVSMIVMFTMLFLDGSFLSYVYCAPITGMCIGKILFYSKYSNK